MANFLTSKCVQAESAARLTSISRIRGMDMELTEVIPHSPVCVLACMRACIGLCVYVCVYVCTYVCVHVCTYVCVHVCTFMCVHVCKYGVHTREYVCVCVCVCMCV